MDSDVKLPTISKGSKFKKSDHVIGNGPDMKSNHSGSSVQGDGHSSPYRLPKDGELFSYQDKQDEMKAELKKNARNLKIWDKKTASTKNPLKNFKNFGHPLAKNADEIENAKKLMGDKGENALLTEAMSIVMDRKKQRDNLKHYSRNKETMTDVVAQKKEIFLVTMTTKIIKDETEKLQRLIEGKKQALHQ